MKRGILIGIAFSWMQMLAGQEMAGLDQLRKIQATYSKVDAFEMTLRYEYYEKGVLTESLPAEIMAKGTLYYAKVGQHVSINNKNCFLHVDNDNQRVNVFKPQKMELKDYIKLPLDSTLQYIEKTALDTLNGKGRLRIHFRKDMKVNYTEMVFDLKTYELSSCKYSMISEAGKPIELKISFLSFQREVEGGKDVFSEKKFITLLGKNQVLLADAYKNYELNNYLNLE